MRPVRWFLYLVLFGAGAFGGLMLVLRFSSSSSGVTVPAVVGFTEEQARFQAEGQGLVFTVQLERYDLAVPKGRVVSQSPEAGMAARKGQALKVVLSKGLDSVTVPEWRGVSTSQAQVHARQAGLKVASLAYVRSLLPAQTVVAQSPPPGTVVPRDAEVGLLVSSGPPLFTFVAPDLTGQKLEKAQRTLGAYGIQAGPTRIQAGGGEPGTVVAQSPRPGYPLERAQIVQLMVNGP